MRNETTATDRQKNEIEIYRKKISPRNLNFDYREVEVKIRRGNWNMEFGVFKREKEEIDTT